MNKKNLLAAFALPLFVAACSSEDVLIESQDNNQYDVAKVDAAFNLGDAESRLATQWGIEAGKDILGFAWLGTEDTHGGAVVNINGLAYQNHPLFAASSGSFEPETSIYVGKYYTYHPYDYSTKQVGAVNFSLADQDMIAGYEGTSKKSIWISPKWTNVTLAGDINNEDKAGVDQTFNIYPRKFTNDANLMMTFSNNDPSTGTPEIKKISVSYLNGGDVVSVNGFTYAPTEEHYTASTAASPDFWKNFTLIGAAVSAAAGTRSTTTPQSVEGVTVSKGAVVLVPSQNTYAEGSRLQVCYNALPACAEITGNTKIKVEIETTYGKITYPNEKTVLAANKNMYLKEIAKTRKDDRTFSQYFDGQSITYTANGVEQTLPLDLAATESFVQRLYKTGRFDFTVDFYDAIMNGMHVENNAELMKMLTYYKLYKVNTNYEESEVNLYLDGDANGEFKISKKALALVQEINEDAVLKLYPCDEHGTTSKVTIVVFNEEDEEDANYREVPAFDEVFGKKLAVCLDDQVWTWNGDEKKNTGWVNKIYNRGQLEINAGNLQTTSSKTGFKGVENTARGSIEVKSVANVKFDLVNKGGIKVNEGKELLAYGSTFTNEATSLTAYGKIVNNGVLGVVESTGGKINNYGYIENKEGAKTYITTNQTESADFKKEWANNNKIGTIMLTTKFDNISVNNATEEGFIKYTWDGGEYYETPKRLGYNVKYNYLIIKDNITFNDGKEDELNYLEIANTGKEILIISVDDGRENCFAKQTLDGFVMQAGAIVNIMEGNTVKTSAAYVSGSRVRVGGTFEYDQLTSYLGGKVADTDNIVRYAGEP